MFVLMETVTLRLRPSVMRNSLEPLAFLLNFGLRELACEAGSERVRGVLRSGF